MLQPGGLLQSPIKVETTTGLEAFPFTAQVYAAAVMMACTSRFGYNVWGAGRLPAGQKQLPAWRNDAGARIEKVKLQIPALLSRTHAEIRLIPRASGGGVFNAFHRMLPHDFLPTTDEDLSTIQVRS